MTSTPTDFKLEAPAPESRSSQLRLPLDGLRDLSRVAVALGLLGTLGLVFLLATDGDIASGATADVAVLALLLAVAIGLIHLYRSSSTPSDVDREVVGRVERRSDLVGGGSVVVIALLAAQSWFSVGKVLAGGDITPPVGTEWLHNLFSIWAWNGSSLGAPNASQIQLPWAVVAEVVHGLGGTSGLAQRIWLGGLFAVAGLAAYTLIRLLGVSPVAAAFGALVYLFNPDTISEVGINGVYLDTMALIAAIPACIIAVARGRLSVRVGAILLVLCAPFVGYSYSNPPLLLVLAGAAVGGLLVGRLLEGKTASKRLWRLTAYSVPLVVAACAYWLLPSLIETSVEATGTLSQSSSWTWTEGRSTVANALWLNTAWGWIYPTYYPYASSYEAFPLAAIRYVLPLGAFLAVPLGIATNLIQRTWKVLILAVAGVAIFFVLLATGTRAPGDLIFNPLYKLPFGWLLREPGRFLLVVSLCYAILLGLLGELALRKWRTGATPRGSLLSRHSLQPLAIASVIAILVLAPGYPLAFGQATENNTTNLLRKTHVSVPGYWYSMSSFLNDSPIAGNVGILPPDDFYQMPYTWGYYGADGFIGQMLKRGVLDPSGQGYSAASSELLTSVDSLATDLLDRNWTGAERLDEAVGTRLLLVRGDVNSGFPGRNIDSPARLIAALKSDPLATLVHVSGPLELFEIRTPPTGNHVVTVTSKAPDLGILQDLPAGTSLVSAKLTPGVAGVVQAPPVTGWSLQGASLETAVKTPSGYHYRLASLGSTQRTAHVNLRVDADGVTHLSERAGASLLPDGQFKEAWDLAVGNCDARPGTSDVGKLNATLTPNAAPDGSAALTLTAAVDTACEHETIRRSSGDLLLSMEIRAVAGVPRVCVWESGLQSCAPSSVVPASGRSGWFRYQTEIAPQQGAGSLRLYLYADSIAGSRPTTIQYADVSVHQVANTQEDLIAQPNAPRATYLLQDDEAYGVAWKGPASTQHVEVDGLRNGWLSFSPIRSGHVTYGWTLPIEVAFGVSGLAAVLILAGLGLVFWGRLRTRQGGSEPVSD